MEDPVDELENEEYLDLGYGEEEVNQGQGKISKILNGGLWIGKKLVITGFFVSSAPVVLPPLLVMSAFGFAVSIPFGAVLAGYTCTEKLMNKLLPMPPSSGMLDYQEQGPGISMDRAEKDEEEEEGRFAMEEEKKQIQDTEESVEMRIELVEDGKNEEQQQENIIMSEMDQNKPEVLLEEPVIVTRVVVAKPVEGETETSSGKNEEREVLKAESTGLLEKIRDETQSGESAKKNKKKHFKKSLGLIGGKKEDKIDTKNAEQTEKIPEILHKNLNNSTPTTDEISPDEQINRNIEISDENQNIITNGNRSEEITGDQVPNKPETAAAKGTNSEISSSEKRLWEQINALRIIVGYKIEHHPTLTEELKALYLFTGVEPHSSFKDFSDIKDLKEKLRFLMSIVGVK